MLSSMDLLSWETNACQCVGRLTPQLHCLLKTVHDDISYYVTAIVYVN